LQRHEKTCKKKQNIKLPIDNDSNHVNNAVNNAVNALTKLLVESNESNDKNKYTQTFQALSYLINPQNS